MIGGTIWTSARLARTPERGRRLARVLGQALMAFAVFWGVVTGLIGAVL